jgi:hypothetical protein
VPKFPDFNNHSFPQSPEDNAEEWKNFEANLFPNTTSEEIRQHEQRLLRNELHERTQALQHLVARLPDDFPHKFLGELVTSILAKLFLRSPDSIRLSPSLPGEADLQLASELKSDLLAALRVVEGEPQGHKE